MKLKILFYLLFIFLLSGQTFSQSIDKEKINNFINYIEQENQDIGSISIFNNGKEIYARNFGQCNIKDLKFNKNTKYHIGSISKLFTATLIWRLIEQGKLNLKDKLAEFFPNMPNAKKIDIKNLLEHSSGLGDYLVKQDSIYFWLKKPQKQNGILKEIRRQGTLFEPGDSVSYSNSGYYLLAKILEKKYHNKYGNILKNQITAPLKLKNTFSIESNPKNVYNSYIYSISNNHWKVMKDLDYNNVVGVGDIVSTPNDLNKFILALYNGEILKKETVKKMEPIKGKEFGRGLMLVPFYEHISYGHGGDTYGTHSVISYNPQNKLAISYVINGERFATNDFAIDILNIIYGYDFEFPKFNKYLKTNIQELKKYVGVYSSPQLPITLTISIKNSVLAAQGTGQPSFPLSKYDSNKFEFKKVGVKIDFKPQKNQLVLKQRGEKYIMTRKKINNN